MFAQTARLALAVLFYAAVLPGASPAAPLAPEAMTALREMRAGDMRKLVVPEVPGREPEAGFLDPEGRATDLSAYRGKVVLLNLWATWCVPCRQEMPALNRLQSLRGGEDFAVVTVATGRNSPAQIDRFFAETGIDALPKHTDPKGQFGRAAGVLGLPSTLLLDREGREIARLLGEAAWDAPEALALIDAAIAATRP